jgi:hypothetical protein
MNERKLKKLFELARTDPPPAPSGNFDLRVLAAIRREGRVAPVSWWDQLGALLPRLAFAAVLVMAACLVADYYYSARQPSSFAEDATQFSTETLFVANGDGS